MATLRFPTKQFRSLPSPTGTSKFGIYFTPAASLPRDLWDWREVNPREVNRRSKVYKDIVGTLTGEPARFHERNRGLTIVAKDLSFDDKRQEAILQLENSSVHGVVDGGHTLDAILEAQKSPPENGWPASVFVKVITGVDENQIAEIAGGLNTSQQVDLKSLENLKDHFAFLQETLKGEPYADDIAYKMNEDKSIDVREVLYYLAVFDCTEYDEGRHPVALFGRKEGIVRRFAEQAKDPKDDSSFRILISRAPEILRLRDTLEKRALSLPIGRYKAGKNTRVRSQSNKENQLVFLSESVNGRIPLGWIMPMLGAFRANVEWDTPSGTFTWIIPIDELIDDCIEKLVRGIQDVHEQEGSRPEYVGRNSLAWRMSYEVVSKAILERRYEEATRAR
ncbi:MAG: AIPR family protein [Gemmatimonadaceae bacterium]